MINNLTIGDISIDCKEPEKPCEFYVNFSGWAKRIMYHCPALIAENELVILFMGCDFEYIPPVWPEEPGRQQKQMHFNFGVDDLQAAVEEAIRFGAVKSSHQYGDHYIVMIDPEGHPFCLCKK